MAKYENIRALAKKQLQAVTESSDRWKAFLQTAAIAYNYSFPNQLLIHEQSPTATAVADIAYWNNNAGRWVKRGAHGIAVFDTHANSSRLRYLFDISDTIPRAEVPEALPWVITDQNWRPVWDKIVADNHADSIQSALLMLSTSCVAQRSAMFTTALGKAIDGSSLQWAKPDEQRQLFLQLITQSCLYMAALRCGVDTARLDLSALESVNQFDTNRITLCLGSACQQAARPLMQQIGSITREIDSVARTEKVRYYGDKQEETNNTKEVNNGVHDGERLPNPGADAERAADAGNRQVRQSAAEFSARERADGVRRDAAGGNAVPASGGDGQRSTPANRTDDADADAAEHRPEPADRPVGLDAVDERLAGPSRGTGDAADLQPVTQEPQAESDTTPSAFSVPISDLPPLSDELILGLLAKESSSRADNAAILEYFNEHPDLAERSAFCKHCYKQIYTYLFVDDHTVGFIRHDMYLELWEGNYLTKTAQVNLTWDAVAAKIADLIEQGRLIVPIKAAPVQQQMEQLMATPKDSVMTGSDSYQKFTVLDEEIEVYLRITKVDEETGKPVLLPDTAFQIYWLDEQGHYRYDSNGNPKLVTMTDTVNGHLTKDVDTFYTNSEGILTLPEKLPLGKYRIVEVTGPNGFYNEWLDSAGYENGILTDDADGIYYVDFEITTDRIYAATGDKNENGMDTLVIGENYSNHETLGKLTIRKTGEVLAGWKTEVGALDPWMTGEAEDGNFVYETRPLAGAEYTITAAEDIYTQDRQTDNYGNRTLWYAKGDVVAVVTTGDGSADIAAFAPARTKATYDFLSVIHDGTIGEVSVTLPLGSYHIEETKPPYGYIGTTESYDVTFAWDNELNDVVMATSIAKADGAASSQSFEVVRSKDANADFTEQQTLKFHNDREKAKVGVYKVDSETGNYLASAVFNLYTADDIYSADGKLLFAAGELVATSPETGADGYTYFDCDIPIRGEYYGSSIRKDATTNSGNYIVKELRAPLGYYVNEEPMEVTFTYDGQAIMVLDNTCANKPTEMWVSKRDLTNDEELPGATLAIKDMDGNTVTTWVSTDEPHRVTGLHFGESYTLTEIRAADGYALANDITFRLIQKSDEDGNPLEECEVYYLTTKNILFWKWDDWKLLDDATVIMQDDITKVQISKKDLTTNEELPGAELTLTDEKGNEIDRWVSTDAPHYMERLPAGKYTLTEVTAPDGYAIAERVEFEVLPTGEVQTFEMFDDTIKVKISKVDITTNEELPGAELVIKNKDGTEIDRWISTNEPHYVEKMPAGDYTLTEITAPNGYKVAESIDFTVLPTGEMQTVVMKDAREDTPTPTPDNTPTPDHTPQPTPNTTPAPAAPTATPTPLLTIPKTGDNSPLGLLLAIAGISLAGLAVLVHKSARRKDIAPRDDDDEDTED